ncbi:MAG: hypothetical protein ACO394_08650 [Blastocatellia bacterium]
MAEGHGSFHPPQGGHMAGTWRARGGHVAGQVSRSLEKGGEMA